MSRLDAIRQRKEKKAKEGRRGHWYINSALLEEAGIGQYRAPEGENWLRIIPPNWLGDDEYFGKEIFVHYDIGVDHDAFLCLYQMRGERCPICERREELRREQEDEEILRALNAWPARMLFFVVDVRSAKTIKEGVKLYDAPKTVDDEIIGRSQKRRTGEVIDISDPDEGMALVFVRSGKGRNTKYSNFDLEEDGPIEDEWMDLPSWDDLLVYASPEQMEKSLASVGLQSAADVAGAANGRRRRRRSEEDEDDEAPPPKGRRRRSAPADDESDDKGESEDEPPARSRRRRRSKTEDEDDDKGEPDEKDDKGESEDEPPARSRRRRKFKSKSEDEDEDEGEPDEKGESEDEPPARSRRRRKSKSEDEDDDKGEPDEKDEDDTPPRRSRRSSDKSGIDKVKERLRNRSKK